MTSEQSKDRKIVFKVDEGEDPSSIYATTYQMRNFFRQFADGFFSSLDVMNYIQHHKAVTMMKKGAKVLDVCCGRGLLLPLMRYYARDVAKYVGVDIHEANINEQKRRSGAKDITGKFPDYYPFPIEHLICSCEDMDQHLEHGSFDMIVYTSAIEHMQKEVGFRSLQNCFNLLKPDTGILYLSCPNTRDKKDPYDTQYAAHLYEWDLDELSEALGSVGFKIVDTFGLVGKVKDFETFIHSLPADDAILRDIYFRLKMYLPSAWLMAIWPILFPAAAAEVLIFAKRPQIAIIKRKGFFNDE
jgi:2-polyprenyl-3-methyl-5-hydroxy-6-metoxy-1,4-benzoquinol methylase